MGQRYVPVSQSSSGYDQLVGLQKVFGVLGLVIITADFLAGFRICHDCHFAVFRILGHSIINGRQVDADPQIRVSGHIFHFLAFVVNYPAVV